MSLDELAAKYREARAAGDQQSSTDISNQISSSKLQTGGTVIEYLLRREEMAMKEGQNIDVNAIFFNALETESTSSFMGKLKKSIDYALKSAMKKKLLVFKKKVYNPNAVPRHIYDMPVENDDQIAAKMLEAFKWEEWGIGREYERIRADAMAAKAPIPVEAALEMAKGRVKRAADWWDETYSQLSDRLRKTMSSMAQDPSADQAKLQEVYRAFTPGIYESPLPDLMISSQHPYEEVDPERPRTWVSDRNEYKDMSRKLGAMIEVFAATMSAANDEANPLKDVAAQAVKDLGLEGGFGKGSNYLTPQMLNPERWGLGQSQLMDAVTSKGVTSYDAMLSKPKSKKDDDEEEEGPSMEGGAGGSGDEDIRRKTDQPQIEETMPLAGSAKDISNEGKKDRGIVVQKDPLDFMRNDLVPSYHGSLLKYILSPGSGQKSAPVSERTKAMLSTHEKQLKSRGLSGDDLAAALEKAHIQSVLLAEKNSLVNNLKISREDAAQEVAKKEPELRERAANEVREYLRAGTPAPQPAAAALTPADERSLAPKERALLEKLSPEDQRAFMRTRNRFEQFRPWWSASRNDMEGRQRRMAVSKAMLQWMAGNAFKPGTAEQAVAAALPDLHFQIPKNKKLDKTRPPKVGQPGQKEMYEGHGEEFTSNKARQFDNLRRLNEILKPYGIPRKDVPRLYHHVVGVILEALSTDSMYQKMLADVNARVPGANLMAIARLRAELRIIRLAMVGDMWRMTRHG
jgi:hypothetical protein